MKPRMLVVALAAVLGSGCGSVGKPNIALRIDPVMSIHHGNPDAQSFYQLGRYYQGQNRLNQAEEAYLKAVGIDEHNVESLNALGSLYAERGELDRSAEMFRRVTTMAPDVAYLYNNLGFAYYLQGRLDDAYAAVLKALSLDEKLERGWVNLEQIAGARAEANIVEVVKSRRLDILRTGLTLNSQAAETVSVSDAPRTPSPNLGLALELSTPGKQVDGQSILLATSAEVSKLEATPAKAVTSMTGQTKAEIRVSKMNSIQTNTGRFVLVSATREIVTNGGTIELHPANPAEANALKVRQAPLGAVRIEVSNGNGVGGFAHKFSSLLRTNKMLVSRITNHKSYSVYKTTIQYDPRYEDVARTLMSQLKLSGRIVPARSPRAGADIRIVLGRDAVQARWQPNRTDSAIVI